MCLHPIGTSIVSERQQRISYSGGKEDGGGKRELLNVAPFSNCGDGHKGHDWEGEDRLLGGLHPYLTRADHNPAEWPVNTSIH